MPRRAAAISRSGPRPGMFWWEARISEMADLALNEPVLQRLAAATGGRYLRAGRDGGASRPAEGRRSGACHRDEGPVAQRLDPARDRRAAGGGVAGPAALPAWHEAKGDSDDDACVDWPALTARPPDHRWPGGGRDPLRAHRLGGLGRREVRGADEAVAGRPAVGVGRSSWVRGQERSPADRRIRAGRNHGLGRQRKAAFGGAPPAADEGRLAAGRAARSRHVRWRRGQVQSGRPGSDRGRLEPDARRRAGTTGDRQHHRGELSRSSRR